MLTDVDKEGAASVSFNDFVEMVTPKVLARDPKVCVRHAMHVLCVSNKVDLERAVGREGTTEREKRGTSRPPGWVFFSLMVKSSECPSERGAPVNGHMATNFSERQATSEYAFNMRQHSCFVRLRVHETRLPHIAERDIGNAHVWVPRSL